MSDNEVAGSSYEPDEAAGQRCAAARRHPEPQCRLPVWMIGPHDGGENNGGSGGRSGCVFALVILSVTLHSCQASLVGKKGASLLDNATNKLHGQELYGHVVYRAIDVARLSQGYEAGVVAARQLWDDIADSCDIAGRQLRSVVHAWFENSRSFSIPVPWLVRQSLGLLMLDEG